MADPRFADSYADELRDDADADADADAMLADDAEADAATACQVVRSLVDARRHILRPTETRDTDRPTPVSVVDRRSARDGRTGGGGTPPGGGRSLN